MNQNRPATSKARGICRYYNHPRGCYAKDACKFLHVDPSQCSEESKPHLTPYDQAKRCKFYLRGFCKRGENCWFIHDAESEDGLEKEDCSICFERPAIYGLLSGCSHIFCISCIRRWREAKDKDSSDLNFKRCPMCRTNSQFITPSSKFWKEGEEGKAHVIKMYKESMSKIPCKYFQISKNKNSAKPACPFGKDCFYQHLNEDGTNFVFTDGIDVSMRKYRTSRSARFARGFNIEFGMPVAGIDDTNESDMTAMNLASNIAIDMFDQMVAETRENGLARGWGIEEATPDRVRLRMVAGAIAAIRSELVRLGGLAGRAEDDASTAVLESVGRGGGVQFVEARPVIVSGTLAPPLWDLDAMDGMPSDNADIRGGWNHLFSGVDIGANGEEVAVLERLEILAEQMLTSLQSMGREDGGGDSSRAENPASEAVNGFIHSQDHQQSDAHVDGLSSEGDGLSSFERSSNSSASEGEEYSDESAEDTHQTQPVRAFDLAFNTSRNLEVSPERTRSRPLFRFWNGMPRPIDANNTDDVNSNDTVVSPAEVSAQHFGLTIVGDESEMLTNDNSGEESSVEPSDNSSHHNHHELFVTARSGSPTIAPVPQEPPFMTDGRGRVIWSNSGPRKADTVDFIPSLDSSEVENDEGRSSPDPPRSLIGRVLDTIF